MTGRFITIEGIEGVGKSTNVDFVAEHFRARGETAHVTREPGGTPMAERIRDLILAAGRDELSDLGELVLMFAARAEHLESLIRPALERGETVVCDRFTDASFAYQGGGRGLDPEVIDRLRIAVQGPLQPHLTLLLDAPLEVSAERIAGRDWQDRFEQEKTEFFGRVRAVYLEIAAREPDRVKLIDASQPPESVQAAIKAKLDRI